MFRPMGGVRSCRSVVCVTNDFSIRTVKAPTRRCFSWVFLFVVAGLAFIQESFRIETDVWIIAVDVVEPYRMMNNQPWFLTTHLTQPAVYGQPAVDECLPASAPRLAFVELLLRHGISPNEKGHSPSGHVLMLVLYHCLVCTSMHSFLYVELRERNFYLTAYNSYFVFYCSIIPYILEQYNTFYSP